MVEISDLDPSEVKAAFAQVNEEMYGNSAAEELNKHYNAGPIRDQNRPDDPDKYLGTALDKRASFDSRESVDAQDEGEGQDMDPMLRRTLDNYNNGYSNGGVSVDSEEGMRRKKDVEDQAQFIELT